jgi:magnesium transporter
MAKSKRRPQAIRSSFSSPGTAPGTLRPVAAAPGARTRITVIDYNLETVHENQCASVEEVFRFRDTPTVTWINIEGLHDVELIRKLGEHFGFHPLALEDVLNCAQRPKVEDYGSYHFLVMKSVHLPESDELAIEQISFFLSGNYVITLQEEEGDSFEAVRQRIRHGKGAIRKSGPDYLTYALLDALVDEFFPVLEAYGERIENLEDDLLARPSAVTLQAIQRIKRELLVLRRAAWPEREVINSLQRSETDVIKPPTQVFLRDCYDHAIQVIDMIETYRDLASGMQEVYLSSLSNRMNEIMKVLTIISTIFIPLSFVAGVWGMNFNTQTSPYNMPELNWYWGYPTALGIMAVTAGSLLIFFRRKGWI